MKFNQLTVFWLQNKLKNNLKGKKTKNLNNSKKNKIKINSKLNKKISILKKKLI